MKMNGYAIYNRGSRLIFFFTALKRKLLLGKLPRCYIDFKKIVTIKVYLPFLYRKSPIDFLISTVMTLIFRLKENTENLLYLQRVYK